MKKSFILACVCIVGYMALTSHLVTKITTTTIEKEPVFTKRLDFSISKEGFRLSSENVSEYLILEFQNPDAFKQASIADEDGQKFFLSKNCNGKVVVNTKICPNGIYYLNLLKKDGGKYLKNFVIKH